ncbi:MAG: TolC family protein [Bacteroidota bacterium]
MNRTKLNLPIQLLSFLIFGSWSFSVAQAPSEILEAYVNEGVEHNLSLQERSLNYAQSVSALQEAKGLFLPYLSFQASYTLAGGGRAIQFPVGDLFNPVYASLNQITGENSFPTDLENLNEQFLPNNFHETKLRLIQPIFDSDIYFNYKARQDLISVEEARRKAYERELGKDIRIAYFQYLQTESALAVYESAKELLQEILRVNKRLHENNKVTYDAIYSAEFELSKMDRDMITAVRDIQVARSYFNFLLNRDLDIPIKIDSSLQVKMEIENLDELQTQALQSRQELRQLSMAQAANEKQVNLNKFQALPKVNAVLDAGYQGFDYTFDEDQDYWLAQFSLSWDIFKGFRNKSKTQQSRIQGDILRTQHDQLSQQIQLQVKQAFYEVEAAQAGITSARAGVKSARDVFRLIRKKYSEDQASLLELQEARTRLTQAELTLNIQTYNYLSRLAELRWAAGKQ